MRRGTNIALGPQVKQALRIRTFSGRWLKNRTIAANSAREWTFSFSSLKQIDVVKLPGMLDRHGHEHVFAVRSEHFPTRWTGESQRPF